MALNVDSDGDVVVPRRPQQPGRVCQAAREQVGSDEADLVLSEVHLECQRPASAQSPSCTVFSGGDGAEVLRARHLLATPLCRVGLQVWRGSLLLADYVLSDAAAALKGCTALELGCGPGLAGLALARRARSVYLTDTGQEVLENAEWNARQRPAAAAAAAVHVRQLDWLDPPDWLFADASEAGSSPGLEPSAREPYGWRQADLAELAALDILLAADCTYEDSLTEAWMRCAAALMRYAARRHRGANPRLLVALERRVVFTLTDTAPSAPAYDFWRTLFREVPGPPQPGAAGRACGAAAQLGSAAAGDAAPPLPLVGWRLDAAAVPKHIQQYERSEYLELWELALADGAVNGGGCRHGKGTEQGADHAW